MYFILFYFKSINLDYLRNIINSIQQKPQKLNNNNL